MRACVLSVAFLIAAGCAGCVDAPASGPPAPVPLALGLSSYDPLPTVLARLGPDTLWSKQETSYPRSATCGRYDKTVVRVPSLSVHGFKGRATLVLVNGKLSAVTLYPADFDAYVRALEARGLAFDEHGTAVLPAGTQVSVSRPKPDPGSVSWLDPKIRAEAREWTERCL